MQIKFKMSKNIYLLLAGIVSVALVVIALAVDQSLLASIKTRQALIARKAKVETQLTANIANLPILKSNFAALGDKRNAVMRDLPSTADFPQLAATMEVMIGASGMKLASITPDPPPVPGLTPTPYNFSISVTGNYADFLKLLSIIQISARPMKVSSFTLSGTTNLVSANVKITTYIQAAADVADKVEVVR